MSAFACLVLAALLQAPQAPERDPHAGGGTRRALESGGPVGTSGVPPKHNPLDDTAAVQPRPTPGVRLIADAAEIEIGEPVTWTLDVEHDAAASVNVLDSFALDRAWVLIDPPTRLRGADPARPGRVHTLVSFRALALEPGELAPVISGIDLATGGERAPIVPAATPTRVRAALGEGEDAPRALHGLRPIPTIAEPSLRWRQLAVLAGVVVLALIVWRLARRRRKPLVVAPPTPLAQLDALARSLANPDGVDGRERVAVYELSRLLRGSVDAFLSVDRAALTDAEWSESIQNDERVPLGVRNTCVRLLARAETIKYALAAPTRFALDELFADARSALEALATTPKPAVAPPSAGERREVAA